MDNEPRTDAEERAQAEFNRNLAEESLFAIGHDIALACARQWQSSELVEELADALVQALWEDGTCGYALGFCDNTDTPDELRKDMVETFREAEAKWQRERDRARKGEQS